MQLKDWQPPWPPIYIGGDQWVVMRDSNREPAAIVRALRFGPRRELYYRVVTWSATSADRALVGYFPDLETADRAVLFAPKLPGTTMQPPRHELPPRLDTPVDGSPEAHPEASRAVTVRSRSSPSR